MSEIINISRPGATPNEGDVCVFVYARDDVGNPVVFETKQFVEPVPMPEPSV